MANNQGGVNDLTIINSEGGTINGERTGINIEGGFQVINGNNIFGKITINNAGSITSSYRTALYLEKLTGNLVDINITNSATGIIKSENSADSRNGADGLKVYFDNGSSGDINITNHGTIEGGRGMKIAPRTTNEEWLGNINVENTGIVRGNRGSSIHLASSGNETTGYATLSNSGTIYGTIFIGSNANNGGGDISIFNTGTIHNNVNMDDGGDIVLKSIGNMEGSLSFDVGIIEDTTKILETLIEIDNIKGTITDYALASRSRDSNVVIKGSITGNVKLRGGNDNLTFRDNDATTLTINGINQTGSNRVTNLGTGSFVGGDGVDTLTFDGFGHNVDNILIGWEEIIVKNTDTSALTSGGIASSGLDINFQNEIRTDTLTIDSGGIAFIDTPISINQTNTPTNLGNLVIKDSQSSGGGTLVVDAQSLAGASALTANSATLSGNLDVINFNSGSNFTNVSGVLNSGTISAIKTTENITTNFDSVSISGENFNLDGIDYLIGGSEIVGGTDYRVGVTLAWNDQTVDANGKYTKAHGTFTVDTGDVFTIDEANIFNDRTGTFTSNWDGKSLTKSGLGTLKITEKQGFTGTTNIRTGTLALDSSVDSDTNTLSSSSISLGSFGTLKVADNQNIKSLEGSGNVVLDGNSTLKLTADGANIGQKTFSGNISNGVLADGTTASSGTLVIGAKHNTLSLSGNNTHTLTKVESLGDLTTRGNTALGKNAQIEGTVRFGLGTNDLATNLSGSGLAFVSVSDLNLTGTNTDFTGEWKIGFVDDSMNIDKQTDIGSGIKDVNGNDIAGLEVTNKITGAGTVNFDLGAEGTLTFENSAGTNFGGTVGVNNGAITLNANTVNFLVGGSTLRLDSEGVATLDTSRTIGNLTLNGGNLDFTGDTSNNAVLTGKNIALEAGTGSTITVNIDRLAGDNLLTTGNLLELDEATGEVLLVEGSSITGTDIKVNAVDASGNKATEVEVDRAVGKYYFGDLSSTAIVSSTTISAGTGALTKVNIKDGQVLAFDSVAAKDTTFTAQILSETVDGSGNATSKSGGISTAGNMTIKNSSNSFSGSTEIKSGTLTLGSLNALGKTDLVTATGNLDLNGNNTTIGALAGAGAVNLGAATTTLTIDGEQGSKNGVHTGIISGAGKLVVTGGESATLGGASTFKGGSTIATNSAVIMTSIGALGTGTINNSGTLALGAGGDLDNVINSAGILEVRSGSGVTLSGVGNNITGILNIDGTLTLDNKADLKTDATPGFQLANTVIGNGTLALDLTADERLTFTSSAGNKFAGTVDVNNGAITLDATTSTFLVGDGINFATLELDSTGSARLDTNRTIGNLTLNGGNLDFTGDTSNNAILTGQNIVLEAGAGSTITVNADRLASEGLATGNLLDLDNATGEVMLVEGTNISGTNSDIKVNAVDASGNTSTGVEVDKTVGKYYFGGSSSAAIVTSTTISAGTGALTKVNIKDGQILAFDSAAANDTTFTAQIVSETVDGSGNATSKSGGISTTGNMTIKNSSNSFSGSTEIKSGTLTLDSLNALGKTDVVKATGNLDLNGNNTTIGALTGVGNIDLGTSVDKDVASLTIDGNQGSVSNQKFDGVINGSGELKIINGESVTLTKESTLTGTTTIGVGSKLQVDTTRALGAGQVGNVGGVVNDGTLVINASTTNDSTLFRNDISGTGVVEIPTGQSVGVFGDNSAFTGSWDVAGELRVNQNTDLGVTLTTDDLDIQNKVTGNGLLTINVGASKEITFSEKAGNEFTGAVNVNAGEVILDTSTSKFLVGNGTGVATLALNGAATKATIESSRTIGNLILNGGNLDFSNPAITGTTTDDAILTGANIKITDNSTLTVRGERVAGTSLAEGNLLNLDTTGKETTFVKGDNIDLTAGMNVNVNIIDDDAVSGTDITNVTGTYYFAGSTEANVSDTEIKVNSGALKKINILSGRVVAFDSTATGTDTEFEAELVGRGGIFTTGDVTISNAANTFTGDTVITRGTLTVGADNAIGATSELFIAKDAKFDLASKTQSIGSLVGTGALDIGNGDLTIDNTMLIDDHWTPTDSVFIGSIEGATAGVLNLSGETITLGGAGTFAGTTNLNDDSKVTLNKLDALGTSSIVSTAGSSLTMGIAGAFVNDLSGAGTVNINAANKTDVIGFTGTISSDARTLNVTKGTINVGGQTTDTTTALVNSSDVNVATDGIINVHSDTTTKNLDIAGGSINLTGDSVLTVVDLSVSGGSVGIDETRFEVETTDPTAGFNLLDRDEGAVNEMIVEATGVVDSASIGAQLDLVDRATGEAIAATLTPDLKQNGSTIGTAYVGKVGIIVSDGINNGVASTSALTRIDINNEESVVFDSRGATDNVFTAQITGAGGVTVDTGAGNKVVLKRDNNSFSGRTVITSGTLELGNSGVLGNSAGVDIAINATLDLATYDITLKGIMGRGTIDLKGQTLTIADDAEVSLFGGYIIGEGNLVKSGTNFLQFSSSTSFTGTTTVNGGVLRLASTPGNTLASTSVTIGEAGTVILGASEVLNDVSGTGSIELVGRHLTFNNDEATEFNGVVKDTGLISKSGTETLSLGGDIGTGTFNIDAGRVKLTTDTAAGTREVTNDSELELSFTNGTLTNNISNTEAGVGDVFVTGTGIAVRGDNTNFDGTWQISGDMNVTEAKHLGAATIGFATPAVPGTAQGVLKVTGMGMNILGGVDGEGIIDINLANIENRLDFTNGGNATGNFTGDMNLSSGTLVMSKDTASTLASGTINVNSGAMVEVSSDQSTGDVVLNGGKMLFTNNSNPLDIDGTLSVTSFDATGGGALELDTSTLTLSTEALNSSMSLLDTDNIIDERVVSTTGTVSGQGQIDILELGTLQGVQSNRDILDANNQKVADAIFDITGVVDAEGVGVGFNLAEVNILPGKTLELNSVGAVDTTLGAKLTGTGNLNVSGTSASDVITLANTDNDFSGKTSVTMGTLALGQDNSLGKTSEVLLNAGTTLDVNGVTQGSEINVLNAGNGSSVKLNDGTLSVKNLMTSSSSVLDFGQTGTMNISGGGELKGDNILSGSGVLNLTDQSILTMDGNNTNSNIGVNVDEAAMLMVQGSLGGSIVNRGMVGFGEKTTRAGSASNFRVTGDFTNSGTLDLTTSSAVNDVMTVNGDFVASPNSTIIFDINSSTNGAGANDKLVVGGNFTGTSEIDLVSSTGQAYGSLANLADASEALVTNFELISASSMNGTLTLAMSDRFAGYSNLARLTGSPFVWKLATDADSANLVVATPGDAGSNNGGGNIDFGVIDLRPSPVVAAPPVILGPEVGAFRSLATSSNEMISDSIKGLHNRLGELRANEKDSERDYDYLLNRENSGFAAWSKGSTVGMDVDGFYDGSFGGVDLGVDYMWDDLGEADILTGAYVGYRHGSFDSDGSESMGVEGNIDTSTLHFGLYTTLFYKGSWYTDLVMQYGHIDSDITADQLTDTVHGNAFTGSVETGYSYNVTENWLIEPQAQVTTSIIDLDNSTFNDTRVDFDSETFVTGRVGARTEYEFDMPNNIKVKPYAKASGLYEFADREEVEYAGLELEGHEFSAGMETGAGLTIQVEDYFSIYGEFDYTTDFDEYDQYKGSFGARYSF